MIKYKDVFSISNEMNAEILVTVRYKAGCFGLGSLFANAFAPMYSFDFVIIAGGDSNNTPIDDLVNAYTPADLI